MDGFLTARGHNCGSTPNEMMMRVKSLPAVLIVAASLSGCAAAALQQQHVVALEASVVDADEAMVAQCQFVGDVFADGVAPNDAARRKTAMDFARENAAQKGATHIIWVDVKPSSDVSMTAHGRAYRCSTR